MAERLEAGDSPNLPQPADSPNLPQPGQAYCQECGLKASYIRCKIVGEFGFYCYTHASEISGKGGAFYRLRGA